MISLHETKFATALAAKIEKAYQKRADDVANGVAAEKYREEVGYLRGLKEARGMIETVRAELSKQ